MDTIDSAMSPLEDTLKRLYQTRPDIENRILDAQELSDYISWMAETYGHQYRGKITFAHIPAPVGDSVQQMLAQRAMLDPSDKQAFAMLSDGYAQQSESRYIRINQDISVGRMLRYMPAQWHTSNYFEIYYAPQGECTVYFERETVKLSGGAILIVAPRVNHATPCYHEDAVLHYFMVRASTFDRVFWSQLPKDSLLAAFFHKALAEKEAAAWLYFDTNEDPDLLQLHSRLTDEFHRGGAYSTQLMNALMTEFFILALAKYESTARLPRTEGFFWKHEYSAILSYIQKNYAHTRIEDVASVFHYSTRQISRVIRDCLDLTYAQLVLKLRMEHAAAMLQRSEGSIDYIAQSVGYSTTSSFYRAFISYYSCTPAEYRNKTDDEVEYG